MINTDCVEIFNIKDRVGEQVISEVRIKVVDKVLWKAYDWVRDQVKGKVRVKVFR